MRFEERVHKYEYKLNDTDDQIIDYILQYKEDVTGQSIQVLGVTGLYCAEHHYKTFKKTRL